MTNGNNIAADHLGNNLTVGIKSVKKIFVYVHPVILL